MDIKKLLKDTPWELTPEEFDAQFQFKRSIDIYKSRNYIW